MDTFNDCPEWEGESCDVIVQGAPLDWASTDHTGQRRAPYAIRQSGFWESGYDLERDVDWMDLDIQDAGDIDVFATYDLASAHGAITKASRKALRASKMLVTLGGDHSVSLAVLRAYSGKPPLVIHFDAHHDYEPGNDHGTWVRNVLEDQTVKDVVQFGCRGWGYTKRMHEEAEAMGVTVAAGMVTEGVARGIAEIAKNRFVHLSVDVDVCDPVYAPGVAYREPGGWTSGQLLDAVFTVASICDVKGLDVVEVIPDRDHGDITSRLANRVVVSALTGLACKTRQ